MTQFDKIVTRLARSELEAELEQERSIESGSALLAGASSIVSLLSFGFTVGSIVYAVSGDGKSSAWIAGAISAGIYLVSGNATLHMNAENNQANARIKELEERLYQR